MRKLFDQDLILNTEQFELDTIFLDYESSVFIELRPDSFDALTVNAARVDVLDGIDLQAYHAPNFTAPLDELRILALKAAIAEEDSTMVQCGCPSCCDINPEFDLDFIGDNLGSVATTEVPTPLDALAWGTVMDGASDPGTLTITYAFQQEGTNVLDGVNTLDWTTYEMTQMRIALESIEAYIDVEFVEITNVEDAIFQLGIVDDSSAGYSAYMYPPNYTEFAGIGVFNRGSSIFDEAGNTWDVGGLGFEVVLHEVGHGLGMAHPHDTGGTSSVMSGVTSSSSRGDYDLNQGIYSVMSYNSGWELNPNGGPADNSAGWVASYAALDVAYLQSLYGANTTANANNTVYDIPVDQNGYFITIWDTGGTDTIRSGDLDSVINLNAATLNYEVGGGGFVSYSNGAYGGFTIANGVVIENATGGLGDDIFVGNAANNFINGGGGTDTVTYEGESIAVDVNLNTGVSTGATIGSDSFSSIENVIGSTAGDILRGSQGENMIIGEMGADTIYGFNGADVIFGGLGNGGGVSGISIGSGQYTRATNAGNDSILNAIDISDGFALTADADIINATTIPHISILGTGDTTTSVHYYAVTLNLVGTTITLDVDYASGSGGSFDSWIELYDENGAQVAVNDDSSTGSGAGGSTSSLDSYLTYTTATAGVYYVAIGRYSGLSDIPAGGTYELQVSVDESSSAQIGDNSADQIYAGGGDDEIAGEGGDDFIDGGAGHDVAIYFGNQADYSISNDGSGTFTISGGSDGTDTLINVEIARFADGDLTLNSVAASITGTPNDDTLTGTPNDDIIDGLAGNDILIGSPGADTIIGGSGNDTVSYAMSTERVNADLANTSAGYIRGDAVGDTYSGIENLTGSEFTDVLYGDNGDNILSSLGGNDRMYGRAGDDTLIGDMGYNKLYGNSGADIMTGGADTVRDRFIYFQESDSGVGRLNRDIITDFTSGEDRIEISRFDANSVGGTGNDVFTWIGRTSFSNTPGELRYFLNNNQMLTIIQADFDGDGVADFEIELTGVMDLLATDFLL